MIDTRLYYFNPYLQESYSYNNNDFHSHLFMLNEKLEQGSVKAGDHYAKRILGLLNKKFGPNFDPNSTTWGGDQYFDSGDFRIKNSPSGGTRPWQTSNPNIRNSGGPDSYNWPSPSEEEFQDYRKDGSRIGARKN